MGLGKQTTSRKCWFGRRCFLLLSLCHLKSPRLSVLNNLGSCAVLSCAVRSWREEALALRLYLLDYCWSLHNSRDGVCKGTECEHSCRVSKGSKDSSTIGVRRVMLQQGFIADCPEHNGNTCTCKTGNGNRQMRNIC